MEAVLTAAVAAVTAIAGVLVGGAVTRRAQDRVWARDQQIACYREVLSHYARFTMVINRAHLDRRGWDYDWGAWSAALLSASLVAPRDVARELDEFGAAVQQFLGTTGARASTKDPLTAAELGLAVRPAEEAQVRLVNAIRSSFGNADALREPLGGTFTGRDGTGAPPVDTDSPGSNTP